MLRSLTRIDAGRACRVLPPPGVVEDHAHHISRHGSIDDIMSASGWAQALGDAVERSGLRGRGGAEFPTARKLAAVLSASRKPVVVANGTEGEPASFKDRVLLSQAPHLVIDGLELLAGALDAREAVLVVHRDVHDPVKAALEDRKWRSSRRPPVRVVRAADGFVAGEASAVVNWIERSRPVPIGKHPRMSARGVAGRPTLVQNVETLAHVALVARHGAQWFRAVGTDDEPGTMLVTLAGAVQHQGVVETEIGVPVSDLLERAGGPIAPLQALLVGGYFGRWVRYEDVATRAYSSRGMGTSVGAGYVGAFPVGACGVSQSAALVGYLAGESAGQCGPCVFGLPAVAGSLSTLAHGDPVDRGLLLKWLDEIPGRGACSHPDGVVAHVASAFEVFGADVERHLSGRCLEGSSRLVLPVPRGQV